ncbi:MAG: hypothetical protein HQL69_08840 [Magnetococcales bacterium]|nr:hypothetical protein [Magnetococcales bacterium]
MHKNSRQKERVICNGSYVMTTQYGIKSGRVKNASIADGKIVAVYLAGQINSSAVSEGFNIIEIDMTHQNRLYTCSYIRKDKTGFALHLTYI